MENAFGFTREELAKYQVQLDVDVHFTWDKETPLEFREKLAQATHVLNKLAKDTVYAQLAMEGLGPTKKRHIQYGETTEGETKVISDTGWQR